MANCESDILQIPLRTNPPDLTDVMIITHADGTSELITVANLLAFFNPTDIDMKVVLGAAGISADGSTYTNVNIIGRRIRVIRNHTPQSAIDDGGGYYIVFNPSTGIINNYPNLANDEIYQVTTY